MASHIQLAEELLRLSLQLSDSNIKAGGIIWASIVLWRHQDINRATLLFELGLKLHLSLPLGTGQGLSNFNWCLGLLCMQLGKRDIAEAHFSECIRIGGEVGNGAALFEGLSGLAWLGVQAAISASERELARARLRKSDELIARVMQGYSQALIIVGEYELAETVLKESCAIWHQLDVRWDSGLGSAQALLDLGQVAWLQGNWALAQSRFEQSLHEFNLVGDIERIARLHTFIGLTKLAQCEMQSIAADFHYGLDLYRKLEQPAGIALSLIAFAALANAQGQHERAAKLSGVASVPQDIVALSILWPSITVIFNREIDAAWRRYSETEWKSSWVEGEQMMQAQAIELILSNRC